MPKRHVRDMNLIGFLIAALFILTSLGCGVEVGNPSEPTPTQPKSQDTIVIPGGPTVEVSKVDPVEPSEPVRIDVRYLVENQYDEAITAALDFAFDNTTVSLALEGSDTRTCGAQADGALVLSHQEVNNSETRPSGAAADATLVTESFNRVFASRMASPGNVLSCGGDGTKPKLDWSKLQSITIDGSLDRTNNRNIVKDPSKELVRDSSVKAIGSHQSMVRKTSFNQDGLKLNRSLSFGTDMEVSNTMPYTAPVVFKTRIETLVDKPLAVNEAYSTDLKLKNLKIISGGVTSTKQDDGLTVVMRYDNVVLDAEGTCRPISGSIAGEIYLPGDLVNVYERFGIAFTEKDNLIIYADGTGSKLEFEPCRIEIETKQQQQQQQNPGNNGGRR